jgi:excisionase family DNA binding protein
LTNIPNKAFFRIDEVAVILGVSVKTIRRRINDKSIFAVRLNGILRVNTVELERLIEKTGTTVDNGGQ